MKKKWKANIVIVVFGLVSALFVFAGFKSAEQTIAYRCREFTLEQLKTGKMTLECMQYYHKNITN